MDTPDCVNLSENDERAVIGMITDVCMIALVITTVLFLCNSIMGFFYSLGTDDIVQKRAAMVPPPPPRYGEV